LDIIKTKLFGVKVIKPNVFGDSRGFFKETFQKERYHEAGITLPFVQDNYSRSEQGVLRGLHTQKKYPQGKLVSCLMGNIYDVVVDINLKSPTFGEYFGIELSGENHLQLWIPPGYAHGFCVLSKVADFFYKCTDLYYPDDEGGIAWNDNQVKINWPITNPKLSKKDLELPTLDQIILNSKQKDS
jgi:dTDP-4-dehydrorhamnose 3,5-epimerase